MRERLCVFSEPRDQVAEPDEGRDEEDQRKASADNPNGYLDRKRIRDADGVAKNVDQLFHMVSPSGVESV